jgi:hypothetical protein
MFEPALPLFKHPAKHIVDSQSDGYRCCHDGRIRHTQIIPYLMRSPSRSSLFGFFSSMFGSQDLVVAHRTGV